MKSSRSLQRLVTYLMIVTTSGFLPSISGCLKALSKVDWLQKSSSTMGLASTKENLSSNSCEFEMQELRAQLNSMKAKGIGSKDLDPVTRAVFANYARQIVKQRPSPIAMTSVAAQLPATSWRLVFSTEAATLGDLPRDATVYLSFVDELNMDYSLRFSEKTFGLNAITAQSKWRCNDRGIVTFVYDKITTDAFGLQNIGVAFFGLLKGRSNFVETAYFDGNFWIEAAASANGEAYFNVYLRDD